MGSRRRFSREFKVEAVKLVVEKGVSVAQAARDLGVAENLLHTWKRKYREDPTFGLASRLTPGEEIRRLRRELKQARQDREILKKAAAYFAKESQ